MKQDFKKKQRDKIHTAYIDARLAVAMHLTHETKETMKNLIETNQKFVATLDEIFG